jgi:hypothetical protein
MPDIAHYKDAATVIGVFVAAISVVIASLSLVVTAVTNVFNYRTNRAKLWLDLRAGFARHDEVHKRLRPGGDWFESPTHPSTHTEFAEVESYMGLLEYCEIMMSDRLIDEETFRRLYSYRLYNILNNPMIFTNKLVIERDNWTDFLALCHRMEIETGDYEKKHSYGPPLADEMYLNRGRPQTPPAEL